MLIVVYETTRTENYAAFQWNILKAVGFILNSSVLKHLKDISTLKNDIYRAKESSESDEDRI